VKFKQYGTGDPQEQAPGGRPRAYDLAHERAREAAIERGLCLYIPLICGHYTTWEDDEQYSAWRPKRSTRAHPLFYCEQGHGWVERAPKYKRTEYPEEPLF